MSKLITIQNDCLEVTISTYGAEVHSIKYLGEEKLWNADPSVWNCHSPVLFPICGRLKDNYYTHEGVRYDMKIHGFAWKSEFELISHEKTSATFLLKSNEETKKLYPFDFVFKVMYKLNKDSMQTYYIVENSGDKTMYYNVGGHEAYKIEGKDLENHSILFEKGETVKSTTIVEGLIIENIYELPTNNGDFPLRKAYFDSKTIMPNGLPSGDSVIIENIPSKRATLLYKGEPILSTYYNDFEHLVMWTKEDANFLAIEPWSGLDDDIEKSTHVLSEKKSIEKLEKGQMKTYYHSVTFY